MAQEKQTSCRRYPPEVMSASPGTGNLPCHRSRTDDASWLLIPDDLWKLEWCQAERMFAWAAYASRRSASSSAAEGRGVPAVDLVGGDPQALARDAADEGRGKMRSSGQSSTRVGIAPRRKRRRLRQPCLRLVPAPPQRL
jgi:hypothetical protein